MDVSSVIDLIGNHHGAAVFSILVVSIARPLGILFGFYIYARSVPGTLMLRISISIALALPTFSQNLSDLQGILLENRAYVFAPLVTKEFAIGWCLGFLASLPFFALTHAGAMIDSMRGETDSGLTDPATGESTHTSSVAFLVVGGYAFFTFDGLELLVGDLYRSYELWPINAFFPKLSAEAAGQAALIFEDMLLSAITIALPMLALLGGIEISLAVAARLGQRMRLYELAFPLRNLAFVLMLPVLIWAVWQASQAIGLDSMDARRLFDLMLEG